MKVVLDAMMWVSYCTLQDGYRHKLIDRARRMRVRFFISDYILNELSTTLQADLEQTKRYTNLAIRTVLRMAKLVELPMLVGSFVPGDADDNPIVQTALSAKADYLVTADREILKIKKTQDVEVITAKEFEEYLSS